MNDNHFAWQRTKPSVQDREFGLATDGSSNPEQNGNGAAPRQRKEPLAVGTQAPDFHLKDTPDQRVSLSDFAGRPVVLAFYPADFSPVCSSEMSLFNELIDEFRRYDAQMLGISVDNVWCHLAFAKDRNIQFPLLSDFHPKGEVSMAYNAYREQDGESERACTSSTPTERSRGATSRRSASTPARTACSTLSSGCRQELTRRPDQRQRRGSSRSPRTATSSCCSTVSARPW